MRMHASEVAGAVDGELFGRDVMIDGAVIDSRRALGGELFVPIVAERDGHGFIGDAVRSGVAAYLTAGPIEAGTAIRVPDTSIALLDLGRAARARLPAPVVGITGSVGKTSTKDLLAAVLATRYPTAASERSFNNELGVPLTLVNAPEQTGATVVEMGARGIGHIARLCEVARPTIGVVTVVAAAHLELFGSVDEVARGKAELVEALPSDGWAVLNAEDTRVAAMAGHTGARVLTFGRGRGDVRAETVALDAELRPTFRLCTPGGHAQVRLGVRGAHQVVNALAAGAAGLAAGVPIDEVASGLGAATSSAMRMQLDTGPTGARILNDAYNANPASMRAALDALAALSASRRIAVIGPMAELGADGPAEHLAIVARAEAHGIRVVAVGAPEYGLTGADSVGSIDEAIERLGPLTDHDAVLVKASRVAGLDRLAERLTRPTG